MESDSELAGRAIEATCAAGDLESALDALVTVLRGRFELWYSCFATHETGASAGKVLASWSVAEGVLDAGAEVSATISPLVISVLKTLREGIGAAFSVGGDPGSLIEHVFKEHGVVSALALPIHSDDRSLMFLVLGSSTPNAFQDTGRGFVTALSTGIRSHVQKLAGVPSQ